MNENLFSFFGKVFAPAAPIGGLEHVAIDEIRNHLDRPLNAQLILRHFTQIFGNRRDGVAFLDGEAGDRKIRAILPDQGDVSPVKRGDKGELARPCHRARQVGADRMRDRVVDVQQVEPFI